MAWLIAESKLSAEGLFWRGPAGESRRNWAEVGADGPGVPPLRARWFFDQPFPKFGRMDALCKAAVAAARLIHLAGGFAGLPLDDLAQSGWTAAGCIEADTQFEASRRAGAPSPALFVYTLPSMFQGEVAIRFGLRGRCTLFVGGRPEMALDHAIRAVDQGRAPAVLAIAADGAPQTGAQAWLVGAGPGLQVLQATGRLSASDPHQP